MTTLLLIAALILAYGFGYLVAERKWAKLSKEYNNTADELIAIYDKSQANFKADYELHTMVIIKNEELLKRIEKYLNDKSQIVDPKLIEAITEVRKDYRKASEVRFLNKLTMFPEENEKVNTNYQQDGKDEKNNVRR